MKLLNPFAAVDIAIDLGTARTSIFSQGQGIVVNEPSVIAIRTHRSGTEEVVAWGWEAQRMLGKEPGDIQVIKPLRSGVIEHVKAASLMVKSLARQQGIGRHFKKPRILIGAPHAISDIERRAVRDVALALGARSVHIMAEPLAAAVGAGLDIVSPAAHMLVDIGSGITEVVVISMAEIALSESMRVGGDSITQDIIRSVAKRFNLAIGERTAETIKHTLCDVALTDPHKTVEVRGLDLQQRLPRIINYSAQDARLAIDKSLNIIVNTILKALEQTPPMLAADLVERGIILSGGGALLQNIDTFVASRTMLPVRVSDDPLANVIRGGGVMLQDLKKLSANA